jgi:hypothetical protein
MHTDMRFFILSDVVQICLRCSKEYLAQVLVHVPLKIKCSNSMAALDKSYLQQHGASQCSVRAINEFMNLQYVASNIKIATGFRTSEF